MVIKRRRTRVVMASVEGYIIAKKSDRRYGAISARWSTKKPALKGNEVAVKIQLKLPDEVFIKPQLQAIINVPSSAVSKPVISAEIQDNIKDAVMKSTGVELTITVIEPQSE